MMEKIADDPFDELPEAFCELSERKSEIRENMVNQNLLKKQAHIWAIRTTRKYGLGWMKKRRCMITL